MRNLYTWVDEPGEIPSGLTGLVEMTLPDKPQSSKQRCRLTRAGAGWIARHP